MWVKVLSVVGSLIIICTAAVSVHIFNENTYAKVEDVDDMKATHKEDITVLKKTYATKADVEQVRKHSYLVEYRVDVKITTDKLLSTQERLWSLQRMIQNDYNVPKGTLSRHMPSKVPNDLINQLQHLEQQEALLRMQIEKLMKNTE